MKIERIWTNIFGSNLIRSKEDAGQESSHQKKNQYFQNQENSQDPQGKSASKEEVEKAIDSLKSSTEFSASGVLLNVLHGEKGTTVEFIQPNGTIIKTMSGEEFLRLRGSAEGDKTPRGSILDQKF